MKAFYKKYGLSIGGGRATAEEKKKFQTKEVAQLVREIKDVQATVNGNFENLSEIHLKNYLKIAKAISVVFDEKNSMMPNILTIGKLQILRRMITK